MNKQSAWFGVTALAMAAACSDTPLSEGQTDGSIDTLSGTTSEAATTTTGEPTSESAPTTTTGSPETESGTGSDTEPSCDGEPNACGGCETLPEAVGEACNGCEDLEWTCVGDDEVRCEGFDPASEEYWPDEDGDGFGDADYPGLKTCEEPPAGWVTNDSDCDDTEEIIHPDGIEVCNGLDDNCDGQIDEAPNEFCDDVCCSFELSCDGVACVPKCDEGEICGADLDVCCGANEICFANDCVVPGNDCEFTEECPVGEVCSQATGQCVPEDVVPDCEFEPPVGEFNPSIGGQWQPDPMGVDPIRDDVVATPIVVNLTDDNADNVTDRDDIPDIVFLTYDRSLSCCNTNATLRIVSGQSNMDGTMDELGSINESVVPNGFHITNDSGIAAGDLDGDGVAEILAITKTNASGNNVNGVIAFQRTSDDGSTWATLWHQPAYPTWNAHTRGGAVISIADLDADGAPEIIVGNVVLNGEDGTLAWDGLQTAGANAGVGNNGFLGPTSAVADVNLDGFLEVAAGNSLYDHQGNELWRFTYTTSNSSCGMSGGVIDCDGFNAIANFDADDEGEIIIVRLGEVFVLDTDGTELYRVPLPTIDCANNESGPPTIADFDGDGRPEIGTASADYMVVVDPIDCGGAPAGCSGDGILWQVTNQDCSSRVTASSVFDFEGDGAAEVVYADETTLRIFSGVDGTVRYTYDPHDSHTRIEMPVIADVDNDGNAEIIVGENSANSGIIVLEDATDNWVRTRRVWNQHAYAITHVTESGGIPTPQEVNWLNERYNNFRQNVQPDGLFHAPDAVLDGNLCTPGMSGDGWEVDLSVLVRNSGALTVPAGTTVRIELDDGGMIYALLDTFTTMDLAPGQFEVFALTLPVPAGVTPPFTIRATVDPTSMEQPNGTMNECFEDNNTLDTLCALPE